MLHRCRLREHGWRWFARWIARLEAHTVCAFYTFSTFHTFRAIGSDCAFRALCAIHVIHSQRLGADRQFAQRWHGYSGRRKRYTA